MSQNRQLRQLHHFNFLLQASLSSVNMQFYYIVAALMAGTAMAIPTPEEAKAELANAKACLPASCQSFGCCSGGCDYWCRACKIPFTC
jgi:hypothetical protein